jgi:hypothetical protein
VVVLKVLSSALMAKVMMVAKAEPIMRKTSTQTITVISFLFMIDVLSDCRSAANDDTIIANIFKKSNMFGIISTNHLQKPPAKCSAGG